MQLTVYACVSLCNMLQALHAFRAAGKRLLFVTNNSSKSRQEYVAKFKSLGINVTADEVSGLNPAWAQELSWWRPLITASNLASSLHFLVSTSTCPPTHGLKSSAGPHNQKPSYTAGSLRRLLSSRHNHIIAVDDCCMSAGVLLHSSG